MANSIINVSIDCSKIDKSKLKDGKYLNITIAPRKEKDQYGNTHTIFYQQSKEQRKAKEAKVYVSGNAKEFVFGNQNNIETITAVPVTAPPDDLPF